MDNAKYKGQMHSLQFKDRDEIIEFVRGYSPDPYYDGPYDTDFIYNIIIASFSVFRKHHITAQLIHDNMTEEQKLFFLRFCSYLDNYQSKE